MNHVKIQHKLLVALLLLVSSSHLYGIRRTHTIYIAGPPTTNNTDWRQESKQFYKALKKESTIQGNSIELFPKTIIRPQIEKTNRYKARRRFTKHAPSKSELFNQYTNTDKLFENLIDLLLNRSREILKLNESIGPNELKWNNKIHLKAYGQGGELLGKIMNSPYRSLVGTLVSFEGEENFRQTTNHTALNELALSDEISELDDFSDESFVELEDSDYEKLIQDYLRYAKKLNISEEYLMELATELKEKNQVVVNITINQIAEQASIDDGEIWDINSGCKGCSTKKIIGTIASIVAIATAIAALL